MVGKRVFGRARMHAAHTHMRTHTRTHARTHGNTHARTHAHARARTRARARTHTHRTSSKTITQSSSDASVRSGWCAAGRATAAASSASRSRPDRSSSESVAASAHGRAVAERAACIEPLSVRALFGDAMTARSRCWHAAAAPEASGSAAPKGGTVERRPVLNGAKASSRIQQGVDEGVGGQGTAAAKRSAGTCDPSTSTATARCTHRWRQTCAASRAGARQSERATSMQRCGSSTVSARHASGGAACARMRPRVKKRTHSSASTTER